MKKHASKHWPLWAILLFIVGGVSLGTLFRSYGVDAATNLAALELSDLGCGSNMNASAPFYAPSLDTWSPWAGDSDNYDPDCMNIKAASSIPVDTDIRIALQARDINTPCGFFWLFKCGDGGGQTVYTPWASAGSAAWSTSWVSDADQWDPDQWRIKVETRSWYGHTISNFKFGLQLANEVSNNAPGCSNAGPIVYSASSTASAFSSWANDGGSAAPSFNCARVKLLTSAILNNPTASLTGTTTVQNGDTVNIPWDVEYINTTTGCTLTGRNSGGTIIDNKGTVTVANGTGSVTSGIPITVATTYTLFCNGFNGTTVSTTKTITPFAGTPPTLSFTMSPTAGLSPGDSSTATVSVENTTAGNLNCSLEGKDLGGATVDGPYSWTVLAPSAVVVTDVYTDNGWSGPLYKTTEGSQSWVVPSDWSNNNQIEVVGGGGGGANGASGKGGGGGGAYSKILDTTALSAGGTVTISVGANGAASSAGGDTYVCSSTSNCTSITGSAVVVGAKGGSAGSTGASAGGQAASGVGTTKYSGGTGGNSDQYGGAGGGGAGGPYGDGKNGGYTNRNEGSGGGGNGGGGNGYNANAYGGCFAGCGGIGGYRYGGAFANCKGIGTGAGGGGCMGDGTRGGLGANGGGGGGGDDDASGWRGGYGGNGTDIGGSVGSGGGGGGGGQYSSTGNVGGNGGLYGGGGGGASGTSAGGAGGQGIIVYQYEMIAHSTNNSLADNTDVHTSTHTVNVTTDYTVTCTGITPKTVRVSLGDCELNGVGIPNGGPGVNFWNVSTANLPAGDTCSAHGPQLRTCTNGVLGGPTAYQYQCVDQNSITITANSISAATAVRKGSTVKLSWNGGNASSCTVTGSDGWNAANADGTTDISSDRLVVVNKKTTYTAVCMLGNAQKRASVTVSILPTVIEI